jgi:hypothetical protein
MEKKITACRVLVRNPEGVELLLRPGKDRRLVSK